MKKINEYEYEIDGGDMIDYLNSLELSEKIDIGCLYN